MRWDGRGVRLYVSRYGGSDSNDGLTESTPLRTIQAAVNKLDRKSEDNKKISIAPGPYEEIVKVMRFREGQIIIEGLDKNNPPVVDGLQFERCESVGIANLNISERSSVGLIFGQCESTYVENVSIRSTRQAITIEECDRVRISGCRISNAANSGVSAADSTIWIKSSTIKDAAIGMIANTSIAFSMGNDITCTQKYQSNVSQIIE